MYFIQLIGKHGKGKYAIVDEDDFYHLIKFRWRGIKCSTSKNVRAVTSIKNKDYFMHRMIMNYPSEEIDHKNRDPLDNRKENLRICTRKQNMQNCGLKSNKTHSIYKGIKKNNLTYLWQVRVNGKYLGCCEKEIDAAEHYDYFSLQEYGEFACLNFPDKDYTDFVVNFKRKKKKSQYIGVAKSGNQWYATYAIGRKTQIISRHQTEKEAAIARDNFIKQNKLDRKLNFP